MSTVYAAGEDESSSDADFKFESNVGSRRYPVHDCCEFEDADDLRQLIFVRQHDSDSSSSSSCSSSDEENDDEDSALSSEDEHEDHNSNRVENTPHSPIREDPSGDTETTPVKTNRRIPSITLSMSCGSVNKKLKIIDNEEHQANKTEVVDKEKNSNDISNKNETKEKSVSETQSGAIIDGKKSEDKNQEMKDITQTSNEPVTSTETLTKNGEGNGGAIETKKVETTEQPDQKIENCESKQISSNEITNRDNTAGRSDNADKTKSTDDDKTASADPSPRTNIQNESSASKRTAATPDAKSPPSTDPSPPQEKKRRKRKPKPPKPKGPSYYCPYDLNERDEDENTPLHIAIHARKLASVRLLLEAGANVHKKCDGSAPVHLAISIGAIPENVTYATECLKLLIQYGADLSAKDESLHTPLYLCCISNLPECANIILSHSIGTTTLNMRADRIGDRALHTCAKFDMPPRGSRRVRHHHHHHHLNGGTTTDNALTKSLLSAKGIEIDPTNNYGRTPLHVAASCGNWPVARLLLRSGANPHACDRRGFTPGALAAKRGMVVPNDLVPHLGGGAAMPQLGDEEGGAGVKRDLIMDPDASTMILCHELCGKHKSCPPITRGGVVSDPPPENVRRLHVLINDEVGILHSTEFKGCAWEMEARRAAMTDVLRVHEYTYVEKLGQVCQAIPDHNYAIASLDPDTAVSHWSFEAAMRAAGSVCEAVDKVMAGDHRNAFCAIRPPGHHAGPRGVVTCPNDPDGSHGFCLLNNVAIGAAYARSMYRNDGIQKVAIIDFDVHHGNGTEEIIRQLVPYVESTPIRTPLATGRIERSMYRPWLGENDVQDVFFASTHGYGPRDVRFVDNAQPSQGGWFYPASGETFTADAVKGHSAVDQLSTTEFLLTQTWTRMGDDARRNCCKIVNVGLELPRHHDIPGMQRIDLRDAYRKNILPQLMKFDPDIIFVSAGFDAHKRDSMNFGYVGMIEDDYEWLTEQLVKVANSCSSGRIVSVLEGGYKIHGGIVSPFARSVASHVRALVEGGCSREVYDEGDALWESHFERQMVEEKERRRQNKLDKLKAMQDMERRRLRQHSSVAERHNDRHEESAAVREPISSAMDTNEHHSDIEGILKEPLTHPRLDHHTSNASAHSLLESAMNQPIFTPRRIEEDDHDPDADHAGETPRKRKRNQVDYKELFEQMKKESFAPHPE